MLKEKTVIVTGGSRGIGQAIGLRCAQAQANVAIFSQDSSQNLKEIEKQLNSAGGKAQVLDVDVTDQQAIQQAVSETVSKFNGIDILVNNTSATCFFDTLHTSAEKFDLCMATSARATFFMSQTCYPYLARASNPHILNISPPLNIHAKWFKDHLAFSISKYAMSLCTLGMSDEFMTAGIAVNSLWPETTIATQTIIDHFQPEVFAGSRWPAIMGDAAYELMTRSRNKVSGQFYTDEMILKEAGVTDFACYAVDVTKPLKQALFIAQTDQREALHPDLFKPLITSKSAS